MRGLFTPILVFFEKSNRSFVLAVRSLWLHKLRAFLSVLGIIIGTAAVISLTAFGEGSMQDALEDIKRQGATNIIVKSEKPPDDSSSSKSFVISYGLTYTDYQRLLTIDSVIRHVPIRSFKNEIRRFHLMYTGQVVGTTALYEDVNQFEMTAGRFLVEEDDEYMRDVAVLGAQVAERLFPFENPIGKTIVLKGADYNVVGVVAERMPTGGTGGSQAAEDFNTYVYIPLRTCHGRFGDTVFFRQSGSRSGEKVQLNQVTLTISDMSKVRDAGAAIRDQLETNRPRGDWTVVIPLDRLEQAERERDRFLVLLAFIGGISLLVGGIGIMNIMLATVTERTREIGIRRALGAKRRDITLQFLVEAIVQTSLGAMLGVVLGLGIVYGLPFVALKFFSTNWPASLHLPWVFVSLVVSISVGVLFGWYPARRASRLDPIEALRHE